MGRNPSINLKSSHFCKMYVSVRVRTRMFEGSYRYLVRLQLMFGLFNLFFNCPYFWWRRTHFTVRKHESWPWNNAGFVALTPHAIEILLKLLTAPETTVDSPKSYREYKQSTGMWYILHIIHCVLTVKYAGERADWVLQHRSAKTEEPNSAYRLTGIADGHIRDARPGLNTSWGQQSTFQCPSRTVQAFGLFLNWLNRCDFLHLTATNE